MNIKNISIIVFSLVISFVISGYSAKNVFLAGSPKVNPFYLTNLKNDITRTKNNFVALISKPFRNNTNNNTASIPESFFKPLTTGVSAYEGDNGETYLNVKKGTKYKIRQIQLSDGTTVNAVDFTE